MSARIAVDIGGTFTDVVLEAGPNRFSAKVLTTPAAPEMAVLDGAGRILAESGVQAGEVTLVIHGTTLATNALIERKGAKTALVTTEGFRDSIEIAYEHRFEQYDLYMERPSPLAPRDLRFTVAERIAADGEVLLALDEAAVEALAPVLARAGVEAVAICFIHSYMNPAHERRVAEILGQALPELQITLSSEVCPEIREYERASTALANAYVQPLMAGYVGRLETGLQGLGLHCPLLLMMSSGGITTTGTALREPVRLVESGPAGGAILARHIAAENGLPKVLSFDMGGTTAKITLIDELTPQLSRSFEVARMYRFLKGSGLPIRIPVIDMVEIGAGGGSIARVDALARITVGPESAGSDPGPAAYARGGEAATVTDADLVMGRIEPARFAGGKVPLAPARAQAAVAAGIAAPLGTSVEVAAAGIAEIVDENMANAARVHAIENGKDTGERTLVAFGGAAPLHAARLADKLGIDRIIVPPGAGVGSAVGFLRAPIAYEVVRTRYLDMRRFDAGIVNDLFSEMRAEAEAVVRLGAPEAELVEQRSAFMRYRGQGHEITVPLGLDDLGADDRASLEAAFEAEYTSLYGRIIPNLSMEVLTWTLSLATRQALPEASASATVEAYRPEAAARRAVFDPESGAAVEVALHDRGALAPGAAVRGPALIVEDETATLVTAAFEARVNALGQIVLSRQEGTR
ncbi:MAG: hydantoinase/oxoprolinase family protein [Alphaproteobacteria bacterium]|nr:hydantoinase/oxoprolinase family protein [Alphaproteobacteria bacterium]